VGKKVPATDLKAFVAYAKANPVNWGSWGAGSHGHLLCEAMNRRYGLTMQHIPYKGEAPTLQGLLSGEIDIAAASIGGMRAHLKSGNVQAIGTIGKTRSLALPDTQTLFEQGARDAAFTTLGWVGIVAPRGTPENIVRAWRDVVAQFLQRDNVRQQFMGSGFEPRFLDSAAFRAQIEADARVWAALIREADVRLD
jgi:tripartite-type tricarboxylate transporter receptor subunit TctC